jgi:hypothetical protein
MSRWRVKSSTLEFGSHPIWHPSTKKQRHRSNPEPELLSRYRQVDNTMPQACQLTADTRQYPTCIDDTITSSTRMGFSVHTFSFAVMSVGTPALARVDLGLLHPLVQLLAGAAILAAIELIAAHREGCSCS